jgi:Carboxypeptidase regulatory-like domain
MLGRFILGITLLACCGAAYPSTAGAQETINYASLGGRVTDPQGAVVPGAEVLVRQTETNLTAQATTDAEGRFRFPYLKVGPYEVVIKQQGFADVTRRLTLTVGAAFELPVSLKVEAVSESVTVSGQAPILEAARSQIAGTVSQTEVKNLPINGRNFLDLALLVPGVSPTNIASTQLCRSAANATSRTTSSSMVFRPTTMRLD